MYYNGQIIHDLDANAPFKVGGGVYSIGSRFAWDNFPKRHTHYIKRNPEFSRNPVPPKHADGFPKSITINGYAYRFADCQREQEYCVATPHSLEEAKTLLAEGSISLAPYEERKNNV